MKKAEINDTNQEKKIPDTEKLNSAPASENKKMEIEITRFKGIVNAFNHPKKLAKLIIVVSLIIVLVFLGITLIALVVKSYYPYKTVNSNEYGATIIQNEDNEVYYWLFNSADLWANSGIKVEKGDVISVRTSGAFHSAIHHLVHDAESNQLTDKWLNPMGGMLGADKDAPRSEFKISKQADFNAILMQVVPEDKIIKKNGKYSNDPLLMPYIDGRENPKVKPDIYAIGTGREKITIRSDGYLYFAVNDIVLTPTVVNEMLKDSNKMKEMKLVLRPDLKKCMRTLIACLDSIPATTKTLKQNLKSAKESAKNLRDHIQVDTISDKIIKIDASDETIVTNLPEIRKLNSIPKEKIDQKYKKNLEYCLNIINHPTELDYYVEKEFYDAWFVDNVGSFLIVIERNKQ